MNHQTEESRLDLGSNGLRIYCNSATDDTYSYADWPFGTHKYNDDYELSLNSDGTFELIHKYCNMWMESDCNSNVQGQKQYTGRYDVLALDEAFSNPCGNQVKATHILLKIKHTKVEETDFAQKDCHRSSETTHDADICCEAMLSQDASGKYTVHFQKENPVIKACLF